MNICQGGKKGNQLLILTFYEQLAVISELGIVHGIATYSYK
jgi:hypothetical protein